MVLSSVCFTSLEILREILSFFDSKIIFLEGTKNSISTLSKNLSKLVRCEILKSRECECQETFYEFRITRKRLSVIDLAVRLQSNGKYEDASDSCQTNPSLRPFYSPINPVERNPSKKMEKKRES